jgi:Tat protein secretion system quality control protein TatD with DNase activity
VIPDAHCHLDQLADPGRAVEEAAAASVGPILAVAMDSTSAEAILALRARHPGQVLAGVGLPRASSPSFRHRSRSASCAVSSRFGRCGRGRRDRLDYKDATTEETQARQREALRARWTGRGGWFP